MPDVVIHSRRAGLMRATKVPTGIKTRSVRQVGGCTPPDQASRFADWAKMPARLLILAVMMAAISGLLVMDVSPSRVPQAGARPVPQASAARVDVNTAGTDLKLYRRIIERVRAGEGYYTAATAMQRHNDYPLRPFFTVRLPTLAWVHAFVFPAGSAAVFSLTLCSLIIFGWWRRLGEAFSSGRALFGAGLIAVGSGLFTNEDMAVFHEVPAGLLIAAGLGLWRPGRYGWTVALVLAAMLIRETAAGVAMVMAVCAVYERRRTEAQVWLAVLGVLAVCMALHATAVWGATLPGDPHSQGWNGWGGWPFLVRIMIDTSPLAALPWGLGIPFLVLALLGWAGWRTPLGTRGALILGGYSAVFMTVARPDNHYWVALIAPLIPLGLLFAPRAWLDLWHAACGSGAQRTSRRTVAGSASPAGQERDFAVNRHHVDQSARAAHRA